MKAKAKNWLIILLPFLAVWLLDRTSKMFFSSFGAPQFHGPLGFVLVHNHGAMLGMFSDLPPVLRIVSLSTGGAFLIIIFAMIQYLLPDGLMKLRTGMSILLGGILGNVADRIFYGYVVDFIIVGTPTNFSPAFNIADAMQWIGYGLVAYCLVREGDQIWPTYDTRRKMWVNLPFQVKYCLVLVGVGFSFSLIAGIYAYTFLKVIIHELAGRDAAIEHRFSMAFLITFSVMSVGFMCMLFILGRVLSHRTAGPIYAFEKFLNDLLSGRQRPLKLRSRDEFPQLEKLAERLSKAFPGQPMTDDEFPEEELKKSGSDS